MGRSQRGTHCSPTGFRPPDHPLVTYPYVSNSVSGFRVSSASHNQERGKEMRHGLVTNSVNLELHNDIVFTYTLESGGV